MPFDIELLIDLTVTNSMNRVRQICDKLYTKYSKELNSLYKENCATYINFMTHISFTLKILSKQMRNTTDMQVIRQIAINSTLILNVINEYGDLDFDRIPMGRVLNICYSIKKLIAYSGLQLNKSTCLGEILNDKDFETVQYYVETGKIFKEEEK